MGHLMAMEQLAMLLGERVNRAVAHYNNSVAYILQCGGKFLFCGLC